jgi:N-acetylmuramoyl-L-alanine amidase
MRVLIMAGHSKSGYIGSGASKYLDESNETRRLGLKVVEHLKAIGVNADYICLDKPKTAKYLNEQVALANSKGTYDVVVQIHFNAGSNDPNSNTTGTETYYRTSSGKPYSDRVNAKLSTLFKNRGSKKDTRGLYWLKYTKCPAILIEVCFVDDKDDAKIYLSNIDKTARLIAEGIANKTISAQPVQSAPQPTDSFKVKVLVDELNIRKDASAKATIVGQVNSGEVFTIVETKGVWGRLKSNAGWINISSKYCKKI